MDIKASVIICTYTPARWDDLVSAVRSVKAQTVPPREIIVVVDHNPKLYDRVRKQLEVVAIENQEPQGLSGARNSGIAVAEGSVVAFLDDDAEAAPDWLARLIAGYADSCVIGVGGSIEPNWEGRRPGWFPEEFDWVVGCTYRGMPVTNGRVRNLIGCNMSFRTNLFEAMKGFTNGMGRIGALPVGCEETEFCIRASLRWPEGHIMYEPLARVYHRVPEARCRWRYFLSRCYFEGLSKARLSHLLGRKASLSSETAYVLRAMPLGIFRDVAIAVRERRGSALARAGTIGIGLATTAVGYLQGSLQVRFSGVSRERKDPSGADPTNSPHRAVSIADQ